MKLKEKKCKGTGKAKGYGCNSIQSIRVYGLGKLCGCYSNWLLNSKEGKKKIQRATLKATAPRRELEKATIRIKSERKLPIELEKTKQSVHSYIRLRDKGKPCISCGTPYKEDHQAGHYFKSELYSTLRFNIININGQCVSCNIRKDGNLNEYSIRLPKRIGEDMFNDLKKLAEQDKKVNFKWNLIELKEIRDKIKELKSKLNK